MKLKFRVITIAFLLVVSQWSIASEQQNNPFSCSSATKLGYQMKWSGAQQGLTKSERGGKYWAFIGQGIRFYMQTRYRKSIGELILYHPATFIDYTPDNTYELVFNSKDSQQDYATLQLDEPWFQGMSYPESGSVSFVTKPLRPTDEPCLEGHGIFSVRSADDQLINVEVVFALDVSGKKYRN